MLKASTVSGGGLHDLWLRARMNTLYTLTATCTTKQDSGAVFRGAQHKGGSAPQHNFRRQGMVGFPF